jgi:hypothetical protein
LNPVKSSKFTKQQRLRQFGFFRRTAYQDSSQWNELRYIEQRSLYCTDDEMGIPSGQQQACETTGNTENLSIPQLHAWPELKNKRVIDEGLLPSIKIPNVHVHM